MILNYNGRHYLERFLPAVLAAAPAYCSVVVADNASTDDSIPFLQQHFPGARLVLLDSNYGFAEGYNRALQQVQADYYVLLNSDVEVQPGWIEPIISLMEARPVVAACQPKIRSYHERHLFEYAGAAGGWIDHLGYPFSRGRVFDVCEEDKGQYDTDLEIFWATGAAMFVRASLFHDMGGFDGYFFAHMEEIDLCWRMQLAGYRIMCCPASVVFHVGGGTLPKGNSRKVYLNFRNNLIMLSKNLHWTEKTWKIPARLLLDAIFAWKNLFTGYRTAFSAVMQAHAGYIRWWFSEKQKKPVVRKKLLRRLQGVYRGSVVWAYFAGKKQRFSEIVKSN